MRHERANMGRANERGYTLTEVMVAITLSVFLLMGLFSILQQTRKTNTTTTGLAQLQDDERVAMTIMADTIESAGYTPQAGGSDLSLFVVDTTGGFKTAGQIVSAKAYTTGEQFTMRYVLAPSDTTLMCDGESNGSGGTDTVFNEVFEIDNNQLVCIPKAGAAGVPLVNNVVNLTFQFLVNTTSAGPSTASNATGPNTESSNATGYNCPGDTWITTAHMLTPDWTNVCAVKVDIVFVNPIYQPQGQALPTPGQNPYITFERVISILSKTGVNVVNSTQL